MKNFLSEFIAKRKKSIILCFITLFIMLIIFMLLGILFGSTYIKITDIFKSLFTNDINHTIIFKIRLPRVLGGVLAGIALATSGAILQALMQNDLASPNTIGVSAGSGLFVVIIIAFFGNILNILPLAAFLGAFITTLIIYLLSIKCGNTKYSIILAGIAITSLFQAIMKLIFVFKSDTLISSNDFLVGSLANIKMNQLYIPIIIIIISIVLSIILSNKLNALALGDIEASSLGLDVKKYRLIFIIISSLLASSVISYAGLIGFVGLIIPHISKKIVGSNNKLVLPISALLGANLVIICDLLSRVVFSPYELPVGIIISLIGVPFFIYLLIRRKK